MKTKMFRIGTLVFKAYIKAVGNGWEVGLINDQQTIFVGNFIHHDEAHQWWGIMNVEMNRFLKRFSVARDVSKAWYGHFFANTLYKSYYSFLDRLFVRHTRNVRQALVRDLKKYASLRKHW